MSQSHHDVMPLCTQTAPKLRRCTLPLVTSEILLRRPYLCPLSLQKSVAAAHHNGHGDGHAADGHDDGDRYGDGNGRSGCTVDMADAIMVSVAVKIMIMVVRRRRRPSRQ